MNQCCNSANWTLRNIIQWNRNRNLYLFIQKMHRKISSAKWRPFWPGKYELIGSTTLHSNRLLGTRDPAIARHTSEQFNFPSEYIICSMLVFSQPFKLPTTSLVGTIVSISLFPLSDMKPAINRRHSEQTAYNWHREVHGANMGPIWGRQDPGGPHDGPMNFAIWDCLGDVQGFCPWFRAF